MYLVNGMIKHSELDDYEQGMIGDNSCHSIDYTFKSTTIEDLIKQLIDFTGHDDVCLNACDEPGRIDIQGMEDNLGMKATRLDIEVWKAGKITLWAVTYSFNVMECLPYTIKDGQEIYIQGEMK